MRVSLLTWTCVLLAGCSSTPEAYSLGGQPLYTPPLDADEREKRETQLAQAQANAKEHPDDPDALFMLAETYRRESPAGPDFTEAVAGYERAIDSDPRYADAYRELGMAHRISGDNAAARSSLERYLAITPDAPDAGIVRGYLEGLE